jgi:hypothetical protein
MNIINNKDMEELQIDLNMLGSGWLKMRWLLIQLKARQFVSQEPE